MNLLMTSMGDKVYKYEKSIVVFFSGKRKVLSTSIYNGGYHEDFLGVFNNDGTQGAGMPCKMLAETYVQHMQLLANKLGLNPEKFTGMVTAANMDNAAIKSMSYKELTVTAIVTGGIETNGGRVGDPSDYYKPMEKPYKLGTINIILLLDSDMPEGTITRALVTCTEAKTAAIQELMAGSNYSTGIATGSGTDQTIIVANSASNLYLEGSGKHSKLGELIGKVVMAAVKEALAKQTGLCPKFQHDALKRLQRFGINANTIWEKYLVVGGTAIKPEFTIKLAQIVQIDIIVTVTSLYVHLMDQFLWGLLSEKEIIFEANYLLEQIAGELQVEPIKIMSATIEEFNNAWENIIIKAI
ncbi:MAG: adenosylcobinamide amidohydrolase [Acidaminococcaceae bacterium]|nr:adenosylcobinamide amidohydrolase [Acidaminococcaceae bacterium]